MLKHLFPTAESTPVRTSDVDYRLLEASKAGDLETVKVGLSDSC